MVPPDPPTASPWRLLFQGGPLSRADEPGCRRWADYAASLRAPPEHACRLDGSGFDPEVLFIPRGCSPGPSGAVPAAAIPIPPKGSSLDWSLRAARLRWAELLRRIFEVDP